MRYKESTNEKEGNCIYSNTVYEWNIYHPKRGNYILRKTRETRMPDNNAAGGGFYSSADGSRSESGYINR
jgi:hypothetical protein